MGEQRENMWKTEQDDWNRRRIIMMKKKNDELDEGITKDNSGHNVDHGRGNDEDENSHRDGDENDKDNKPSPIEPNNKTNAEKYKNSTPTKQSQLSDSKDNTPLTTQNTLKNRTQLMLNKQGKPNKAKVKSAKAKAAKAKAAAKAKIAPKKVYRKVKVATKSPAEPKKKGQRSRQSLRQKVKAAKKDGDENDKDNKPSPIEPNNKTNSEKYKNSTPTKQSQLSDSKDNTPLTTQNTLKNRTQLMLNKQGKPNNNTKIGEQGQDGTAPVLSNAKSAKAELKAKKAQVKSAKAKAAKAKAAAKAKIAPKKVYRKVKV